MTKKKLLSSIYILTGEAKTTKNISRWALDIIFGFIRLLNQNSNTVDIKILMILPVIDITLKLLH